ncbi:TonB-dependent receptor plug domain-containing protein [Hymenobacter psoromatis]|uniref:TonB-dependent receptor plug domain-containing protein n=1 Tax=Hymenobacter psoromatis TaxID=1484116 RepID=UPI001CC0647F|nr:TonB-dependent receptor plug domain-containing protein [Hymenobacter psoromatis]
MTNYYLSFILLSATLPAAAQATAALPHPAPADTLRPAFRGTLPDSLAAAPTPGGTFRLQGQEQPIRPFLTIQDQLRTVAGVQVTPYDGSPGSGQVVRIRGASRAQDTSQPLYIINGLPALNDELTPDQPLGTSPPLTPSGTIGTTTIAEQHAEAGANPLQLLPPESIESIEVLAGPAAVARYGALGANGVISIRTRRRAAAAGQPLRVRYSAYGGVQQVRHRYDLLDASAYASIANAAYSNRGGALPLPYPSTQLGAGTDWQAETYRVAGLQQHQLSLEGRAGRTAFLLSTDYRRQSGVGHGSDLQRYGLRLALDRQLGERLTLRATATLGQTTQRLPYATGLAGTTRAALLAPPTAGVYTPQGGYSYDEPYQGNPNGLGFTNPVALSDNVYRTPNTRRLLGQLAADYQLAPHLTVQASANFQRTLLDADSYMQPDFPYSPAVRADPHYGHQSVQASQWSGRLALHYQRQLGRHQVGVEVDYQYQARDYAARKSYQYTYYYTAGVPVGFPAVGVNSGYLQYGNKFRLHQPWGRVHYALDSTLRAEVSLSYAHFRQDANTEFYPAAQLSWQPRLAAGRLAPTLWLGAARTGVLGFGFGTFGPVSLTPSSTNPFAPRSDRQQAALRTDQLEVGLRMGAPGGRFSGQLVAYQRQSHHVLLNTVVAVYSNSGDGYSSFFDEGTIRNQGLELTGSTTWHVGRVRGTTRLVASLNRNRLQGDEYAVRTDPAYNNHPVAAVNGYQQDGLAANGTLRFRDANGNGRFDTADRQYLGSGIPGQLAGLSQQLRLGRLALDMQLDGQFGYQVLNHQLAFLDVPSGYSNNVVTARNYWTPTNQNTTVPAPGSDVNTSFGQQETISNRLLENGSHVRLSSLTVAYRLRQTATQDLSFWVGAQNLLVLTSYRGYDPNVSSGGSNSGLAGQDYGAVPLPRTWLLGVRATL